MYDEAFIRAQVDHIVGNPYNDNIENVIDRCHDEPLIVQEILSRAINESEHGKVFAYIPHEQINDELANVAMSKNPLNLKYMPIHLKTQKRVEQAIEDTKGAAFLYAPDEIKNDQTVFWSWLQKYPLVLKSISRNVDPIYLQKIFLEIFNVDAHLFFDYMPEKLRTNTTLILSLTELNEKIKDYVLLHVEYIGLKPSNAEHQRFVVTNITPNSQYFDDLPSMWKKNINFMGKMAEKNSNDAKIMLVAVKLDLSLMEFASQDLKNNASFMIDVLMIHRNALRFISEDLRNNHSFMIKILKINPDAVDLVSNELLDNHLFMTEAVKINPNILRLASPRLLIDRNFIDKVVLSSSVELNETLIHNSSFELLIQDMTQRELDKSNIKKIMQIIPRERVLEILKIKVGYWVYVKSSLQKNVDFLLDAVKVNPQVLGFIKDPNLLMSLFDKDRSLLGSHIEYIPQDMKIPDPFIEEAFDQTEFKIHQKIENRYIFIHTENLHQMVRDVFMRKVNLLLKDVPESLIHPRLVVAALDRNYLNLEAVPDELLKDARVMRAVRLVVQKNGLALQFIKAEDQTSAIIQDAINQNPESRKYIRVDQAAKYITVEESEWIAKVAQNSNALFRLPESFQTKAFFLILIDQAFNRDFKRFESFAPKALQKNKELQQELRNFLFFNSPPQELLQTGLDEAQLKAASPAAK